jgi:hypothetical protein
MSISDKIIPEAVIASRIITVRNEKNILDVHLAELYMVETRVLKQAVKRNIARFPSDFMFELTVDEIDQVVSQNVIPSKKHIGGAKPFAFTENGVAMLSGILKSTKAIEINIAIMRTFTMLRKMLYLQKDVILEIQEIKNKISEHGNQISLVFEYLKQIEQAKQSETEYIEREPVGFKLEKNNS